MALGDFGCAAEVALGDASGTNLRPTTFQQLSNRDVGGIDLLLMIDNSSSMADKQKILSDAVPQLLGQLVAPNCVDAQGNYTGATAQLGANPPCTSGTPEFNPVNNIHVGIVTSSLGDHGANTLCTPGNPTSYTDPTTGPILQPPDVNDQGYLVGTLTRAQTAPTDILTDTQSQYATSQRTRRGTYMASWLGVTKLFQTM